MRRISGHLREVVASLTRVKLQEVFYKEKSGHINFVEYCSECNFRLQYKL